MRNLIVLSIIILGFASCQKEITKEGALSKLQSKSAYNCFHYAPLHIGRVVLTGENHKDPQKYISQKYGKLIDNGLIEVKTNSSNSWRTSIEVSLTEAGHKMCDTKRSDDEHAFVAVCKLRPIAIDTIIKHTKDSIECRYTVEQQEITDFGDFLGFEGGKKYNVKEIF